MGAFQGKKCLNFVLIKWIVGSSTSNLHFNAIHWTGMNNTIADKARANTCLNISKYWLMVFPLYFVAKFHYEQFNVTRTI